MKKIYILIAITLLAISAFAQSPEAFNYNAVVRNEGRVLRTQPVNFKISILKDALTGTAVYVETHSVTTNKFGFVNLKIGSGTVVSGVFADIEWGAGTYYAKIEIDAAGGTNYITMETHKLLSIPFALYARTAENGLTEAQRSSIATALQTEADPTFTASAANNITDAGNKKIITIVR